MLLVDSLEIADQRRFEPDIRNYISLTWLVPQQRNKDDCGFFVLYLIDLFMRYEGYPYFMDENRFTAESVQNFCNTLIAYYGR
ncbi:hypothetical protein MKX03_029523 [Papaver bracteatum]|nr:hypothetical protein MKX03_029523 [Papaver bracteatum]